MSLVACTPSSPDPGQPAQSVEPPPKPDDPEPVQPTPVVPSGSCEQQIADYLAKRAELSHCESDSDCAEMWPALCPHGPYYIHRDADAAAIIDLERAIMKGCEIPECEPPIELGIAHCEAGKCAPGRAAPPESAHESCWDYRETWLEAEGSESATTSSTIQGITPHIAISPAAAGVLVLEIDWPADCSDCRLSISEHNSGMSQLVVPKSTRTQAQRNGVPVVRERLELPVTPGPYHMIGMAGAEANCLGGGCPPSNYIIRADLRDAAGELGRVTRHGVGWQRMCEG